MIDTILEEKRHLREKLMRTSNLTYVRARVDIPGLKKIELAMN